jgi:phosphomannomutase
MKIKFGTDGWRAIIGQEFTTDNVARVAKATADWLKASNADLSVVIGHDARFGGALFMEAAIKVLCVEGIHVYYANGMVTTPMLSLGCKILATGCGVVITASHNPPSYNGYKLKSPYGGPTNPDEISIVETFIPEQYSVPAITMEELKASGKVTEVDLEQMYFDHVMRHFDMDLIKSSGFVFAYDAMYGAGQKIVPRLFPDIVRLHCEDNPGFKGIPPEPLHKNLIEFSSLIAGSSDIAFGFANDGDADRIGAYDKNGRFIDSHHIILLLIHYLHHYKQMSGKVVVSFTVSNRVKKLCAHYGLPIEVTKVGFKYICDIMVKEDVLVGAEESGGLAIKGHIPERDGVWIALVLMEFMAKTGRAIDELIDEVYAITGPFAFERYDLHITEDLKQRIVAKCKANEFKTFGPYQVQEMEDTDGWKYFLSEHSWVMIRASGTEPVLRVYSESNTRDEVIQILDTVKEILLAQ